MGIPPFVDVSRVSTDFYDLALRMSKTNKINIQDIYQKENSSRDSQLLTQHEIKGLYLF